MNKSILLIVCSLASLAIIAPQAASAGTDPQRKQFQQRSEVRFGESDRNHDGKLSLGEWRQARNQRLVRQFHRIDRNGDGKLTRDEIRAARAPMRSKAR